MSTQINVTVGQQPLLDKSNQQTQANRQAFLEQQRRAKVSQEGKSQRDASRAQRGVGPDGKPLYGQAVPKTRPWEEPAAWRIKNEFLPYFWYRQTTVSTGGKTYLKLLVSSGDSSQSAEYTFSSPNVFSHLAATQPTLPAAPEWTLVSNYYTSGSLGNVAPSFPTDAKDYREETDLGGGARDVCIIDGDSVTLTAPDGFSASQTIRRKRRLASGLWSVSNTRQRFLILPLGNKKALVVFYLRQAAHHRLVTFNEESTTTPLSISNQVIPGNNSSRVVTTETSFTYSSNTEIKNAINQEESVCFLVGQSTATVVDTPHALLDQLRSHVGELVSKSETGTYQLLDACPTTGLNTYSHNHTYPLAPTFIDPATGTTKRGYTYPYTEFAYQRTGEAASYVDFNGPSSQMKYEGYGVVVDGGYVAGWAGPLSWYYLDSIAAATSIVTATTHEQLRAISTPGISLSVADALPYSKYLGDPAFTGTAPKSLANMLLDGNVFAWRSGGGALQGSLNQANYPYGGPPWTKQDYLLKKAPSRPSASHSLIPIYDWGNKALCSAQKARYGIP